MEQNVGKSEEYMWGKGEVLRAIEHAVERIKTCNDRRLFLKAKGLAESYQRYEETRNPIILEDIIVAFADIIEDLIAAPAAEYTAPRGINTFSYMAATPMNTPRNSGAVGLFADSTSTQTSEEKLYYGDVMQTFENILREEAEKKGRSNPSTIRIYLNCIERELLWRNGEYNLDRHFDLQALKTAIVRAVERLKHEEWEENRQQRNEEFKRYKKNEIAALNKLDKMLDEILRAIGYPNPKADRIF